MHGHSAWRVAPNKPVDYTLGLPGESAQSNGTHYERPVHLNPETKEQREKRLTKRAKLTLKAFRIAYENHHRS
jgi:hypothetical protein